jgi:DNA replication protein DnaC
MLSIAERRGPWAPARFRDRTLDGYEAHTPSAGKALEAARQFAAGDLGALVLAGPTGVGKTHLAVAASQERGLRERQRPCWCSVPELIVGLRSDIGKDRRARDVGHGEARWETPYLWADAAEDMAAWPGVLVLDDLGREKASDWTGEVIYALVNRRYEDLRPTVVTTNLTSDEVSASPYWPVLSRLAEDGRLARLDAADYRVRPR